MTMAVIAVLIVLTTTAGAVENPIQSPPLEKAKNYIDSNRPAEALRVLSAYHPRADELSLYHQNYAKAYELSKRRYDAIAHLRLAYLYSPQGAMKEQLLIERAEAYFKMGFYAEAAMSFRIALRKFPGSHSAERAYLGLADSLYKLGNYSESKEFYDKAGTSSHALSGKANALNAMGRSHDAYILYQEIISKDSGYLQSSQETLYSIGENLIEKGELSTAKVYLTSVTDPILKYRAASALGQIALQESRTSAAVKHFTSALQSPERHVKRQALLSLADVYMKLGKQEEAKSRLLEIRNKYPYGKVYDKALLMLSQIYKKGGNTHEAGAIIKELVLRKVPDTKALEEFEGMILEAQERNQDELLRLWKAGGRSLLEPERSTTLLKIAAGLRHFGKPFFELCTWLTQHGVSEAVTQSHMLLADFYADMGDVANASWHLQQLKIKGTDDGISRIKAKVFYTNKDYQSALEAILSINDVRPEDIFFLSGLAQWIAGNRRALDFYERALNEADAYPKTYVRFADILYDGGRKSDALKYYKTAVSLHKKGKDLPRGEFEWSLYRIAMLSQGEEAADALRSMQKGNEILSRFSMIGLKESNLTTMMNRMF